ncbi:glycoside hydrolase family 19 protein [Pedobacter aquae]|uniref:Glycoside hydrolase family 19 protein n=1 Tax=Pedobacter aquae TaxID=2605747 RepID=A0A5C0VK21_9SPHI|nr:glycoside hydrolase family 19 protein [Pedobacter aquae]QEK52449.1 glycoside hydrolase family 19 protein [Pedobacter aquae]
MTIKDGKSIKKSSKFRKKPKAKKDNGIKTKDTGLYHCVTEYIEHYIEVCETVDDPDLPGGTERTCHEELLWVEWFEEECTLIGVIDECSDPSNYNTGDCGEDEDDCYYYGTCDDGGEQPQNPCVEYGPGAYMAPCGCIGGTTGRPSCPTPCPTSKEDLDNLFPNAPDQTMNELNTLLNTYMGDFGIDTKEELQHFLAQAGHETGGFNNLGVTENLNYSAQGLLNTWPSRFSRTDPTKENPDDYANDPEKIANFVYGNRLGNNVSGDGYKFRGRGIFQLTGKSNYQEFQNYYNQKYDPNINLINNPNLLVSNHTLAVISALWFYQKRVLDKVSLNANTSVEVVTKKVNGGKNGLSDRITKHNLAKINIDCND